MPPFSRRPDPDSRATKSIPRLIRGSLPRTNKQYAGGRRQGSQNDVQPARRQPLQGLGDLSRNFAIQIEAVDVGPASVGICVVLNIFVPRDFEQAAPETLFAK